MLGHGGTSSGADGEEQVVSGVNETCFETTVRKPNSGSQLAIYEDGKEEQEEFFILFYFYFLILIKLQAGESIVTCPAKNKKKGGKGGVP